jgi:hypothetical protein
MVRRAISSPAPVTVIAMADPEPKIASPTSRVRRRPNRSPTPRPEAAGGEDQGISVDNPRQLGLRGRVDRAMEGIATLRDDIAATTAASAMHTTAVIAPWRTARPSAADRVLISGSPSRKLN